MSVRARIRPFLVAALLASLFAVGGGAAPAGAVPPTEAPELLTPEQGATVSANPVLHWSPVAGAVRYRVQVATAADFAAAAIRYSADTFTTYATPPVDLPN